MIDIFAIINYIFMNKNKILKIKFIFNIYYFYLKLLK